MTLDEIAVEYVTLQEAMVQLSVHDRTIRRHIQAGRLPAVMFAGRYLIPREAVAALRETRTLTIGRPVARICPKGHFKKIVGARGLLACTICISDGRKRRRAAKKAAA